MKGYKVFNPDWSCRDFQYEVGKTYEEDVIPECCERGFHFCKDLTDCFAYYDFNQNNKVAEVESFGEIDEINNDYRGNKCCTNKIRIVKEIKWNDVLDMVNYPKLYGFGDNRYLKDVLKAKFKTEWLTEDMRLKMVKENGLFLKFIENQTPEICLVAVKQNGCILEYVKEQTSGICLEAVKQNGYALEYVKDQIPEICLEAVKQNGYALRYVKKQTPEICIAAIKEDGCALR